MRLAVATFAAAAAAGYLLWRRRARRAAAIRWFCRRLPKVELHAHLHGSARLSTIADLAPPGGATLTMSAEGGGIKMYPGAPPLHLEGFHLA